MHPTTLLTCRSPKLGVASFTSCSRTAKQPTFHNHFASPSPCLSLAPTTTPHKHHTTQQQQQVLVLAIFFRKSTPTPALEAAGLISAVIGLVLFLEGLRVAIMPMVSLWASRCCVC